ncbi:MAG: hypothetical protein HY514_03235 [Candidatus Aenigmarchaeota archaeon]|nr:hypothetical protein [Candidatus Aenigmarchaeota archaeon]
MQRSVQLLRYVEQAIAGGLVGKEPYNLLTRRAWRELARHVYADETVPNPHTGCTWLPRGTQVSYGRSAKRVLCGVLLSAVDEHRYVENQVPHFDEAGKVYVRLWGRPPRH